MCINTDFEYYICLRELVKNLLYLYDNIVGVCKNGFVTRYLRSSQKV